MQYVEEKITEEIAQELLQAENVKQAYEKYCSPAYRCGYGYYGCSKPMKYKDEWYVLLTIGDTCD